MPEEGKNMLKYSPGHKLLKSPFIIYEDLECLLKKEQPRQKNAENSYTDKKANHKPSDYSLSFIYSFDETKSRRKFYRRKDCIENFCEDLNELTTEIINYKEKEIISLQITKSSPMENKKHVIYARKVVAMINIRKANITFIITLQIIATTPENLEELLIIFAT